MPKETSLKEQIYRSENQLSELLEKFRKNQKILPKNRKTVMDFVSHAKADGLTDLRIFTYLRCLKFLGERTEKSFKELTKKDMEKVFAELNSRGYAGWTIETYKKVIKRFYRWLFDLGPTDPLPDAVRWIRGQTPPVRIQKENLLTPEDVKKMMDATPNIMYKAMISVLYEGALRPGELLNMKICNVFFNGDHVTLKISGKMEKKQGSRDIYLFKSYDLLHAWIESHPFKEDRDHALWIVMKKGLGKRCTRQTFKNKSDADKVKSKEQTIYPVKDGWRLTNIGDSAAYGGPITLYFLGWLTKTLAEKSGILKANSKLKINPYSFRHSMGTQLHKQYKEAIAKKIMGHTADSKMASVYVHLNEEDVLESMKQSYGIASPVKDNTVNETCSVCGHVNSFGSILCLKCKKPLGDNKILNIIDDLEKNEKINKVLKFVELIESDQEIMSIIGSKEWQLKQADRLKQTR